MFFRVSGGFLERFGSLEMGNLPPRADLGHAGGEAASRCTAARAMAAVGAKAAWCLGSTVSDRFSCANGPRSSRELSTARNRWPSVWGELRLCRVMFRCSGSLSGAWFELPQCQRLHVSMEQIVDRVCSLIGLFLLPPVHRLGLPPRNVQESGTSVLPKRPPPLGL